MGVGNSNPLQHSCLGNPMDREESGGLYSQGVKHNLATKQQQHSENGYITFKGERAAFSTQNMEARRREYQF